MHTVALYGGSFNPPHVGHAMVASWVVWTGQADAVWWTPSFAHPFAKELVDYAARLAMVEAVVRALGPAHVACAVERDLPTPSYTVDVLDVLAARHPEIRFRLVLGADNLPTLDKWKEAERLQATYAPVVVGRDGYDNPAGTVVFPGVSSTDIRTRAAQGAPVGHLVPAAVREEVLRLYSAGSTGGPNPIQP